MGLTTNSEVGRPDLPQSSPFQRRIHLIKRGDAGWNLVQEFLDARGVDSGRIELLAHQEYAFVMNSEIITVDPEIMSGEPVFTGTRMPIRNLIDYLAGGHSLDDFLEGFPGVEREQVVRFLRGASSALLSGLEATRKAA